MVEFDKLHELTIEYDNLPFLIEQELNKKW